MGNVVPTYYANYNDDTADTFTNTSYAERDTLDFTPTNAGDFLIMVSAVLSSNNTLATVYIRAQIDDTTTIMEGQHVSNMSSATNDARCYSTFYKATLTAAAHFVDIDTYISSASYTGTINYAKIVIIRIDDIRASPNHEYAATEGELTPAAISTWYTAQTLNITPSVSSNYLIIASCEVKAGTTTTSVQTRINYDAGAEYIPLSNTEESATNFCVFEGRAAGDYYSWGWAGIVTIPASAKVILMEYYTGSTSARVRKRRLIAIKIDDLAGIKSHELTTNASTAAQWTQKGIISFTPNETVNYLILATITIKPDAATYSGGARLNHTVGTGTGVLCTTGVLSKDSSTPADAIPLLTFHVKSLTSGTGQDIETQWGYLSGSSTVYSKCSVIVAFKLTTSITTEIKSKNGVLKASVKTANGLAIASVKTMNGIA